MKEGAGPHTPGILRKEDSQIPRGNADGYENKGVVEKATQKVMETKELKIDHLRSAVQVARTEYWREKL